MNREVITVYGSKWCGDCFRVKFILDRRRVPYQWIDINKDQDAKKLVIDLNNGNASVPTILFEDGTFLTEPSTSELLEKLGIN